MKNAIEFMSIGLALLATIGVICGFVFGFNLQIIITSLVFSLLALVGFFLTNDSAKTNTD